MPAADSETLDVALDLSSGYGSESGVAALTDGLFGLRVMMLRTLMSCTEDVRPDLALELAAAFRVLADLQLEHPGVVSDMLCYPHTGPWLNRALTSTTGADHSSAAEFPVEAELAYLGWLAAAAAAVCRPHGRMALRVRDGVIMLPGLGLARLDEPGYCGPCEMNWNADGELTFTGDFGSMRIRSSATESDPRWLPLRFVRGGDTEPPVLLDDLDPYRVVPDLGATPRLDAAQSRQWQADFASAWALLTHEMPACATPMRKALRSLAPLTTHPVVDATSHTAAIGVGCVYTTAPADPCQLALTLVHEIQHTKFNLLIDQVELFTADPEPRFYAPWRDDPRPIHGLMHGIYAFFGVTDFWRTHRHSECHGELQSHADFELWRLQVGMAIDQALASGLLTEAGTRFLTTLSAAMRPWARERVPAAARGAARWSATAHETFWRVRNLVPNPDVVATLAAGWWLDRPITVEVKSTAAPQEKIPDSHRRLPLAALLKIPGGRALTASNEVQHTSADRALLSGYLSEALARYSGELRDDPLRPQAWAGLAVSLPKLYGDNAFPVLRDHPEVAAHVYRVVGPEVEPVPLLRYLSTSAVGAP
ncbi:HEXXH motif domain-containing protein [Nocardia yamanashiensis]|uniref:HEXXH motif domain-containing protein n=1 Tax=Nocardia yamanashiensis TaxID=209247 RepID=UPI0008314D38|nr:HEXXH motif domain-containing protein [Nocardia yamanashiensis]